MQQKKGRRGVAAWLEQRFDVLPDTGGIRIEILGRERLLLEGCRKILKYGEREMLLDLGRVRLRVCGEQLWCSSFVSGALGVGGQIRSVCFEEDEA